MRDEVKEAVGEEAVQQLAEGKSLAEEDKSRVVKSLSKAIEKLERYQIEINLRSPLEQSETQQASLQAQNELIDGKIHQYISLCESLNQTDQPRLTREADSMSQRDYVELQRSRLPAEAKDNPEVLAKLGAGYLLYKGAAKLGEGISALDDVTGNVVSGAMHKLGEGFEWIGTHTRRFVRDDLGLGQRVGQNAGDIAQIAAEIFTPGVAFKGIGSISKIIGASKFRAALGERFGLYKADVSASKIGLDWSGAIFGEQSYGMVFENYLATLPEFADIRLPRNFKTFDFWEERKGRAISVKTLNTNTTARLLNPNEIYYTLKGYVDKTLEFTGYGKGLSEPVTAAKITTREIQLGIPANTGLIQWTQIQRAIEYGRLNNVTIVITRIGK